MFVVVVLITGASLGIGRHVLLDCAKCGRHVLLNCAKCGATIVITARDEEALKVGALS